MFLLLLLCCIVNAHKQEICRFQIHLYASEVYNIPVLFFTEKKFIRFRKNIY